MLTKENIQTLHCYLGRKLTENIPMARLTSNTLDINLEYNRATNEFEVWSERDKTKRCYATLEEAVAVFNEIERNEKKWLLRKKSEK